MHSTSLARFKHLGLAAGFALLLSGCAHQKMAETSATPAFFGTDPGPLKAAADKGWAIELDRAGLKIKNKAIVRAARGNAVILSGGTTIEAKPGVALRAGDVAQTDANAQIDLFLGENGPVVRLLEKTSLRITRLDLDSSGLEKVIDTMMELHEGKILGSVKKMAAASKYQIWTRAGIAGIRGTEYSLTAEGELNIVEGAAVIRTKSQTFNVHKGQSYHPNSPARPKSSQ